MKLFVSHKFTGISHEALDTDLRGLQNVLENAGHQVICTFWDEELFEKKKWDYDQILQYCIEKQSSCDGTFAYITYAKDSTGMKAERDNVLDMKNSKKHLYIVAINSTCKGNPWVNEYLELADYVITFDSHEIIGDQISTIGTD